MSKKEKKEKPRGCLTFFIILIIVWTLGYYMGSRGDDIKELMVERLPVLKEYMKEKTPEVREAIGRGFDKTKEGVRTSLEKGKQIVNVIADDKNQADHGYRVFL